MSYRKMSSPLKLLCVFSLVLSSSLAEEKAQFRVIKEWDYINFTWPNPSSYLEATQNGGYAPENITVSGVMFYDGFYYLSMPRMKGGVPATLGKIPAGNNPTPLVQPFPDWSMNKLDDCDAIQNCQNVEIDSKGQMWILDSGRTNTLSKTPTVVCTPKLIIYDLKSNKTTRVHHFLESVASKNASYLYDLVVDDADGGYAYITDNSGRDPGIIVYSLEKNLSWKIRHSKTMRADPTATQFKIDGTSINVPINIAGIALGPKVQSDNESLTVHEDKLVYYCPLSSLHLYAIKASDLRNQSNSNNGSEFQGNVQDIGIKSSQSDGMIIDDKDTLYYGLLKDSSIAKWDTKTPFASGQRIISRDAVYVQWPNSFAFDGEGNIVVLTNRLHVFAFGMMNIREPNFRLLSAKTGSNSYVNNNKNLRYDAVETNDEPTGDKNSSLDLPTTKQSMMENERNVQKQGDGMKGVTGKGGDDAKDDDVKDANLKDDNVKDGKNG